MSALYGKVVVAFGKREGFVVLAADGGCTELLETLGEKGAIHELEGTPFRGRIATWEGYVHMDVEGQDDYVEGRWRGLHIEEVRDFLDPSDAEVIHLKVAFTPEPKEPTKALPKAAAFCYRPGVKPKTPSQIAAEVEDD